jgi:hypothetical protein
MTSGMGPHRRSYRPGVEEAGGAAIHEVSQHDPGGTSPAVADVEQTRGTSPSSTIGCIQPISRSITTPASTVGIEEKANPWNAGGNSKVDQKK